MAQHRAQWKGYLKVREASRGVSLYTAAFTSERITFNAINTATRNRVIRIFVDSDREEPVPREAQVKGLEFYNDQFIMIDPEEISANIPQNNKTLEIEAFVPCSKGADVYHLPPSSKISEGAFTLLRDGINTKAAAVAGAVLFRRMWTMLDLGKHIIWTKMGEFDPATFDDRYEQAAAELVKAKIEGKALPKWKEITVTKPSDLLATLRESGRMKPADKPRRTAANANAGNGRRRLSPGSPRSIAQNAVHPVHRMLITFPIVFVASTLFCDLAFWRTEFSGQTALWLRYAIGDGSVIHGGLLLSLVVFGIFLFTGWKGWEIVYRDRSGVADYGDDRPSRARG